MSMDLQTLKYIVITVSAYLAISFFFTVLSIFQMPWEIMNLILVLLIIAVVGYFIIPVLSEKLSDILPRKEKGTVASQHNFRNGGKRDYNNYTGDRKKRTEYSRGSGNGEYIEKEIFNSVNEIRKSKNLPLLKWNKSVQSIAKKRAQDIVRNFSHSGCPSGYGENIAMMSNRNNIPKAFIQSWMSSRGHRENILGKYGSLSIGVTKYKDRYYAVQLFQ